MAYYQNANSLVQLSDPMFDKVYGAGDSVTFPGIYKCAGCEREIAANGKFPLAEKHAHFEHEGEARWKLIVWAR